MTTETTEFLTGGLRPVSCRDCGTRVLVKKNSEAHTSIQWMTDAASSCPFFAEQASAGVNTALLDTCGELGESIAEAVGAGLLEVGNG
ncbi:MAG: hypothetical protein JWQ81_8424 [Amycolatopsis sp.]|jgi:hypothetical protein|uniref:hypothetical protein n=1 Tax=Amycolatopsis sp. TaxID=37632 RepID=UPI00262891A2|nr:hypothetical protein [Amycolatopsis sp.]MCU1687685.1 hypothetical protein [Amycolatopsis sp.]